MRAFLLLTAAVSASIAIGVAALSSRPTSIATVGSANRECCTSSRLFEKAFASAISGLRPLVHGQVPYGCVETTRNAALRVEDAGQMNASLGAERIVAVALTLHNIVADEAYAGPPGSHAPRGDYITFNFNRTTGALTDFGLRMLSAKYPASNLSRLGAVTSGTVILH